jgi:hypothetical protein
MGLKCSIFGCDYGETEVEREREEDGSEVIVTIRETETCKRCGDVHLVSENKEVTTMETAADIVADDLEDEPDAQTGVDVDNQEAETPPGGQDVTTGPATEQPVAEEASEPSIPDAETEKAVKMSDPDSVDTSETPPAEEDDAVILDDEDDSEDDEDEERVPGEWPDEPENDDDWEQPTEAESTIDQDSPEITSTGSAVTVPEGDFHCPECGYTTPVESSSLRAGDYCPECHRGSLRHETE